MNATILIGVLALGACKEGPPAPPRPLYPASADSEPKPRTSTLRYDESGKIVGWYCTRGRADPKLPSLCERDLYSCENFREGTGNPDAFLACEYQREAACFAAVRRINNAVVTGCSSDFSYCSELRLRTTEGDRAINYTRVTECMAHD